MRHEECGMSLFEAQPRMPHTPGRMPEREWRRS